MTLSFELKSLLELAQENNTFITKYCQIFKVKKYSSIKVRNSKNPNNERLKLIEEQGKYKKIQEKGLVRNTIDKFYTSTKIVDKCINYIKKKVSINNNDLVIEPSAGNGSFINAIKKIACNYKFYDIEPENDSIIKQDYLKFTIKNIPDNECYKKIHVVGNPPFGRQSSLAIKFIKTSCEFCHTISFILPKSFKKESLKKHFPLNFHLLFEYDLPDDSFIVNDKEYNVPCVFQIWEKKDTQRKKPVKLEPKNFKFVKQNENPDISFRRVGVYAGKISKEIENKSKQSHYFIKFNNKQNNINKLINISFKSKNHTVGPKSISKQELIKEFNKII